MSAKENPLLRKTLNKLRSISPRGLEQDINCSSAEFIRTNAHLIFFNEDILNVSDQCEEIFNITTNITMDDLIVDYLDNETIECEWLYCILKRMTLSREMIRRIFDGVLYKESSNEHFKMKTLNLIIEQYSEIDSLLDLNKEEEEFSKPKNSNNLAVHKATERIDDFTSMRFIERNENTANDNVYVLINKVWEEYSETCEEVEDIRGLTKLFQTAIDISGKFLMQRFEVKSKLLNILSKDKMFLKQLKQIDAK